MEVWFVAEGEGNQSLINFIDSKWAAPLSKKKLKEAIDSGSCRVNGAVELFSNRSLSSGDRIQFHPILLPKVFTFKDQRVLFENDSLLIYDKPSGLVCDKKGIEHFQKSGTQFHLVHRLDKMTSGALILAKDIKAKEALENLFRKREVEKNYLALVDGTVEKNQGTIKKKLGAIGHRGGQKLRGVAPNGKDASTGWEVVAKGRNASLLRCYPETGRTHQIRIHLAAIGHPILGDYLYGKRFRCKEWVPRILLHAEKITFKLSEDEALLVGAAPIPADFLSVLESLNFPKIAEIVERSPPL